jgi:enamine deaminase RidA (YjgF/YER057c/UK114 family)
MKTAVGVLALLAITCLPAWAQTHGGAEARLTELHITLPPPAKPVANYVEFVRVGNLLFLAGQGSKLWFGKGKLGKDLTVEQGYQAAHDVGLGLLATMREALGSLDKVKKIVKVNGMVNSAPGSTDQAKAMNGFSDLMTKVFGDAIGKHTRSVAGVASLPFDMPVEIDMIVEVRD